MLPTAPLPPRCPTAAWDPAPQPAGVGGGRAVGLWSRRQMDQERPQTGWDLHLGAFPALIFIPRRGECPGVALRCASALEGRQAPTRSVRSPPPARNAFAVNSRGPDPGLGFVGVAPCAGRWSLPAPCAGEPAQVRHVRGAPFPRAGRRRWRCQGCPARDPAEPGHGK